MVLQQVIYSNVVCKSCEQQRISWFHFHTDGRITHHVTGCTVHAAPQQDGWEVPPQMAKECLRAREAQVERSVKWFQNEQQCVETALHRLGTPSMREETERQQLRELANPLLQKYPSYTTRR